VVKAIHYLQANQGYYVLGIAGATIDGIGMILGDAFIRSSYIVFDRQNEQLGFAQPTSACD
jgi:hypothetical protein